MKRREFLANSTAAAGLAGGVGTVESLARVGDASVQVPQNEPFTLKFSPDFGMFEAHAGEDPVDQIKFGYDHGFRAWESTGLLNRSVAMQEKISTTLHQLGMEFGQFVGHMTFEAVTFAGDDQTIRERVLDEVRASVEVARRMNTDYVHVVLGRSHEKLAWGYQMANATELLKRCAEIFEPHDLVLVMEPMNHRINHPGMFLHTVPQAYQLCRSVDSPSVKILYDIYHVQIQEGNLIPNIDLAWDEIDYFQIGDTPGRNEPLTGEINYRQVFAHIHEKGYEGFLGLEHDNSKLGREGEQATLEAYRRCDPEGNA